MSDYTSPNADWEEAFATLCPSPEEVEQERAYWKELHRQQDLEDYLEALAAENATDEEPEDWNPDPEPTAPAAAKKPERPAKFDGLTKSERSAHYDPENWEVSHPGGITYLATNRVNGAVMEVAVAFG